MRETPQPPPPPPPHPHPLPSEHTAVSRETQTNHNSKHKLVPKEARLPVLGTRPTGESSSKGVVEQHSISRREDGWHLESLKNKTITKLTTVIK